MGIDEQTVDEPRGLDRRTLIKRAAAAGALVWTAPVVINSMASPAAAGTCECEGVFYLQFINQPLCGDTDNTYNRDALCQPNPATVTACLTSEDSFGAQTAQYCISTIPCPADQTVITWTIDPTCTTGPATDKKPSSQYTNCKCVSGEGTAKDGDTQCIPGQVTNGLSITFDRGAPILNPDDNGWTEWRVVVCCADTPA